MCKLLIFYHESFIFLPGVNHKDQQYGSPGEDVITSGKKNGAVRSAAVSPSSDADVPDAGQDEKVKERVTLRTWDPVCTNIIIHYQNISVLFSDESCSVILSMLLFWTYVTDNGLICYKDWYECHPPPLNIHQAFTSVK